MLQVVEEDVIVCILTVSKAAVRSRRVRRDGEPESAAIWRSLVTLTKAVSVLWGQGESRTGTFQKGYCV